MALTAEYIAVEGLLHNIMDRPAKAPNYMSIAKTN